ncbi:MAG: hypothetical protein AAGB12_00410 [Pseudomonadota bacterium]
MMRTHLFFCMHSTFQYLFYVIIGIVYHPVMASVLTVEVLSIKNKPLEEMVVYASPKNFQAQLTSEKPPLTIKQKEGAFTPYINIIQRYQSVNFVNIDDITHHIYSVSGKTRFSFKLRASQEKKLKNFTVPEDVAMGCNIHDWMSGFILVVDTPYFGKTNAKGKLKLNLPPEEYTIVVWHPQMQSTNNRISKRLILNNNQEITFQLSKAMQAIPAQDGLQYLEFDDY